MKVQQSCIGVCSKQTCEDLKHCGSQSFNSSEFHDFSKTFAFFSQVISDGYKLLLLLWCAIRWCQPLDSSLFSRMKLVQPTIQLCWGTRFHDMRHHLNLTTWTQVRSRQSPSLVPSGTTLLCQVAQWPGAVQSWFNVDHYFQERSKPGGQTIGSSTSRKLSTEAEIQSSHHRHMSTS